MLVEVKLPRLSEDVSESVIVFWHKSEGDRVKPGDVLLEVQTEKAVSEIEAEEEGVLTHIVKKRGDVVEVGEVLAVLSTAADASETVKSVDQGAEPSFVRVPPRVRKRARELWVDLAKVVGTGPRGMITVEDVEMAAEQYLEQRPFTASRKVTADRMMKSLQTSAQLTITAWTDVTELKQWRDNQPVKVSWNSLCLYAAAQSLKKHPEFNAHVQNDTIQFFSSINLGVAVDTEVALHVPVIKSAERLSLEELEQEANAKIEKAKNGKLTVEDYKEGTFTVTNLGGYGVQFFTPIINPPQVAILGIGAIESYVTIEYGDIVVNDRLPLSLTFDHRANDGGPAARFLQTFIHELNHVKEAVIQQ